MLSTGMLLQMQMQRGERTINSRIYIIDLHRNNEVANLLFDQLG